MIGRAEWVPEEASSAQRLGVCLDTFQEKLGFEDHVASILFALNEAL